MALLDLSQSHWQSLASNEAITTGKWNSLISDLATAINGGLDRANMVDAGLLPGDLDGTAFTLDDGSITGNSGAQTVTRQTAWSNTFVNAETVISGSDTTPSVDGVRTLHIDNTTGSAATITRFDDPVEGQELIVFMYGADNVTLQATAVGSIANNGEIITATASGTDVTYVSTDEVTIARFHATDLGGDYANVVWLLEGSNTIT